MKALTTLAVLLLAASGVASADQGHDRGDHDDAVRSHHHFSFLPVRAPEIDPASTIAGLTLLGGGLAVLRGRRSKKPKS